MSYEFEFYYLIIGYFTIITLTIIINIQKQFKMSELKALVAMVVADGIVDPEEVTRIKEVMYADGTIDKDEADAMFEINDAVTGNNNCAEYQPMFVQILSDHVLKDEETPGVVDEEEGAYLVEKIGADGQVDDAERALLLNVEKEAIEIKSQALLDLIALVK